MKYAHRETERRFLVGRLPDNLGPGTLIQDRYLDRLRIRLRRMSGPDGEVFKLTQKIPEGPSVNLNTTFYLDAAEYAYLRTLPGYDLEKTRYRLHGWAIDVFAGPLHGLVLAEIELQGDVIFPNFLGEEVTADERYAGGNLAQHRLPQR